MLVFDSADFEKKTYAEFVSILKMLAKLLSSTFIFSYMALDIMLNLPYKNNFLFIFFHKISGLTSTTFSKEEFIPRRERKNGDAHKLFMPQATCKFCVLWKLRVRAHEGAREIHKRSRTCTGLLFCLGYKV